jgi:purine-binding chemotaxis protein CheW
MPPAPTVDGHEQLRLATFEVGGDLLAIDIMRIREIARPLPITPVPRSPHGMVGVIDLRGQVLPLFDLRVRFELPPRTEADDASVRHLVVRLDGQVLAIVVDRMRDVVTVERSAVRVGRGILVGEAADVFVGVAALGDRLALLLNLRRVILRQDRIAIAELMVAPGLDTMTGRGRP